MMNGIFFAEFRVAQAASLLVSGAFRDGSTIMQTPRALRSRGCFRQAAGKCRLAACATRSFPQDL